MTDHIDTRARRAEGLDYYAGIRNGDLVKHRPMPPASGVVLAVFAGFLIALAVAVALLG